MNNIKVSSNHQIVVPKKVREQLGVKSGQILYLKSIRGNDFTLTTESPVDKYYGKFKGVWGPDIMAHQRHIRSEMDPDNDSARQ